MEKTNRSSVRGAKQTEKGQEARRSKDFIILFIMRINENSLILWGVRGRGQLMC